MTHQRTVKERIKKKKETKGDRKRCNWVYNPDGQTGEEVLRSCQL